MLRVECVLDVQGGDSRPLILLHRVIDVERRLAPVIAVDDGRDGDLAGDAPGDVDHFGRRDQTPVRDPQVRPRHHAAADVDGLEAVGLRELGADHGVALRRHHHALPPQEGPELLSLRQRRSL